MTTEDFVAPARHAGRRWSAALAAIAAAALLAACSSPATAPDTPDRPAASATSAGTLAAAPAGLAFYTPPTPLPGAHPGDVIWARALTGAAALPAAAHNWLVLYRSTDTAGRPIAVSGTVAVPRGTPPAGGWPVISWAHGTTGIADVCAPSRDGPDFPDKAYVDMINRVLDQWLQKGYAVLKTDYAGLGTPGPHPYLNGYSEARAVTDIARAARHLDSSLGSSWVAMGHSQGGQATLYTAALGPLYAPELRLRAAVAIAPPTFLSEQVALGLKAPDAPANSFFPLVLAGMAASAPGVQPDALLTPKGRSLVAGMNGGCTEVLAAPGGWDAWQSAQVVNFHADFTPLQAALKTLADGETLRPTVPLLLLQAANDQLVHAPFTVATQQRYANVGVDSRLILYKDIPNMPPPRVHEATVAHSLPDAMAWVAQHMVAPQQ